VQVAVLQIAEYKMFLIVLPTQTDLLDYLVHYLIYILAKLPHFIGCSVEHTIDESKQCFKRISFKDGGSECDFRPSVHLTIVLSNKKLEYEDKHDSRRSNTTLTITLRAHLKWNKKICLTASS
jgi:hypothetical protein